MAQDEKTFLKEKNLLDLKYQAYLNYFNIAAISFVTVAFTVIWAFLLKQISMQFMVSAAFVLVPITSAALGFIYMRLTKTYSEIKRL